MRIELAPVGLRVIPGGADSGGLRRPRMTQPRETVLQKLVENQHGKRTGEQWVSHVRGGMEGPMSGIQEDLKEIVVFFHRRRPYLAARRVFGRARANKRTYHPIVGRTALKCHHRSSEGR